MASTYLSLTVHIVFSTKNRHNLLWNVNLLRTHEYMGGVIKNLGAKPLNIGGMPDHVHLLVGMKADTAVAPLVRELKKASNTWIREELRIGDFAWQEGYAAFSVGGEKDAVSKYIDRQAEHHRVKTSLEELIEMLCDAGIEYDPKYLE